jgi:hypothetical protein
LTSERLQEEIIGADVSSVQDGVLRRCYEEPTDQLNTIIVSDPANMVDPGQ